MATNKTYLISLQTLKADYPIDENLDDKYIKPQIIKCQDIIVRPLLGDDKWNEIVNQIDTNTVSEDNDLLIKDYIQPLISYYIMSEVMYATAYKLKNVGITEASSDRFDELVRISKKYLIDSDAYQSRLKQYMCLHTNLTVAPLYRYKSGLYLGM